MEQSLGQSNRSCIIFVQVLATRIILCGAQSQGGGRVSFGRVGRAVLKPGFHREGPAPDPGGIVAGACMGAGVKEL